ncbi:MAG: hypothetical protein H6730_12710 [Deltaproteobacteria bacterium]|nr:hypothetical protein [Deltaproteobacteria bacterium]
MQQNRVLLDSDVDALVGALDGTTRAMARDLGCAAGSPDLGYLVTPGRLLQIFRDLDPGITGPGLDVRRDYTVRYKTRYPSLRVENLGAAQATLTLPLRQAHQGGVGAQIHLHARAEDPVTVHIEDGHFAADHAIPVGVDFQIVAFDSTIATSTLSITVPAGGLFWLGLVESRQDAGPVPTFWAAGGRYHLDGQGVTNLVDSGWLQAGLPRPTSAVNHANLGLAPGSHLVAYVEGWERHVTYLDDPAIAEVALGGPDTTTRTEMLGLVRAMPVAVTDPDELRGWFRTRPVAPTLEVTVPGGPQQLDPCALPLSSGYIGEDNRLYRFEVQTGGDVAAAGALVKWSRNNGADAFAIDTIDVAAGTVVLLTEEDLEVGHVLELITEQIELSEANPAVFAGGVLVPGQRMTGQLVRVTGTANSAKAWQVKNLDGTPLALDPARFPAPPAPGKAKARLWHGLVQPTGVVGFFPKKIEDGLEVTLSGRVHPGQWWAYEARVRQGGGSGAMVPAGPDRVLAPLALLRHDGDATPLTLVAWLDERFRSACALSADDIAFDGSACESGASTVQEMLDLLCARAGGGCCEATLEPSGGDDATKIQELLDDVDPGGSLTICLKPGVYRLDQPIVVEGKRLALEGCPSAVIETREDDGLSGAFNVEGQSSALSLARLTFLQRCRHLVWADVMSAAVEAEEVTFICARDDALGVVIASGVDALPLIIYPDANAAPPLYAFSGGGEVQGPRIVLRRVTCIGAGWMVAVAGTTRLVVEDTTSVTRIGGILAGRCIEADVVDWTHASAADFGGIEVVKAEELAALGLGAVPAVGQQPLDGGVGLAVGALEGGSVERCAFSAAAGVYCEYARATRFVGNRYATSKVGLWWVAASGSMAAEEQVTGGDVGLAVHGMASDVTLRDCVVNDAKLGVQVAMEASSPFGSPDLTGLRVTGNQIATRLVGINLGGQGGGRILVAEVQGNRIVHPDGGVGISALAPGNGAISGAGQALRIVGNRIEGAHMGMTVLGPQRTEITDNTVVAAPERTMMAVVAAGTQDVLVEDNLFEFPGTGQRPGLVGIVVYYSQRTALRGNSIRTDIDVFGMLAMPGKGGDLEVFGNDFGAGYAAAFGGASIELHRNRTRGAIACSTFNRGVVNDNSFGAMNGESFAVLPVSGRWQVQDNRASGAMRLLPRVTSAGLGSFGNLAGFAQMMTARALEGVVAPAAAPATTASAAAGVETRATPAPVIAHGERLLRVARDEVFIRAPTETELFVSEALHRVDEAFIGGLVTLIPVGPVRPSIGAEQSFRAQVVGNWSATLQVGFRNPWAPYQGPSPDDDPLAQVGATPSKDTVVQVVANMVDHLLVVNSYANSIVTNNTMRGHVGVVRVTAPQNTGNIEVP